MALQGQKWVWGYLSVMMINYCSLIFCLPIPWGPAYGSSVSVNVNLQHKDGQAREPERKNSFKIQTCTHSQPHMTEGWDWNSVHMGWGNEDMAKRGKNCRCSIWSQSSFSPQILERIFFHSFLSLLPGYSHATWYSVPLPAFCVPAFRKHSKTCVDYALEKNRIIPSLLLGGFTLLS